MLGGDCGGGKDGGDGGDGGEHGGGSDGGGENGGGGDGGGLLEDIVEAVKMAVAATAEETMVVEAMAVAY